MLNVLLIFLQSKQSEHLEDIQQKFSDLPNNSEGNNIVNNFTIFFFNFQKIILKFCI